MQADMSSAGQPALLPEAPAAMRAACPCGRTARVLLMFAAGLAATVLAFDGIVRYGFSFQIAPELLPIFMKERPTAEEAELVEAAFRKREYSNTALQVAILGAAAGGLLGLAAGAAGKSVAAASAGLVGGTVLGAVAGAAGGIVDLCLLEQL